MPLVPKDSVLEQMEDKTEEELANQGSSGK